MGGGGSSGGATKHKAAAASGGTFSGHEALPAHQLEAVKQYQEGGIHQPLNAFLRGQRGEPGPWITDNVPHLDAAIAASRINKETILYRGWTAHSGIQPEHLVGMKVKDPAYLSTTTQKAVAEKFAGSLGQGIILRIRAPAGSKGLHVHETKTGSHFGAAGAAAVATGSTASPEHEVLLPRNSSFKITGAKRRKDGIIVANAELQ